MVSKRRYGRPLTEAERKMRHKTRYGTTRLPKRGTGQKIKNPGRSRRAYLPYGLTKREKADPKLRRKLASCIRKVEKRACPKSAKKDGKYDYKKCFYNPVAVCRKSLSKKKKK